MKTIYLINQIIINKKVSNNYFKNDKMLKTLAKPNTRKILEVLNENNSLSVKSLSIKTGLTTYVTKTLTFDLHVLGLIKLRYIKNSGRLTDMECSITPPGRHIIDIYYQIDKIQNIIDYEKIICPGREYADRTKN